MNRTELTNAICKAAADKKASNITIIDISSLSVIADDFIICSAVSGAQVRAICDNIEEQLSKAGVKATKIDGYQEARWVVLDYGDALVHVFKDDDRIFYNLERLWSTGGNARLFTE